MSKVDDELTRRFLRAERPLDGDGPFEVFAGLERRRAHHERVRKVRAGALAVAVIAATVVGFVGLRAVFDETTTDVGEPSDLPGNGEIVFVGDTESGRIHLFAARPDGSGLRQLTWGDTNDSDPSVSPDGRAVAYSRDIGPGRETIAVVPIEGGSITWQTEEHYGVTDPAWSPDGSRIAFISHTVDAEARLFVAEVGTDVARQIAIDAQEPGHPTWSPDGTRIAVAAYRDLDPSSPEADLAIVRVDDGSLEWLDLPIDDGDEQAPAWSPDGSRIAFLRPGSEGYEVWTASADGRSATVVATAIEALLINDLDWAPDGSALLVSDGEFVYRVDATPDGDSRVNFDQLFRGFSPSWQPIPAGMDGATPETSASASPQAGRDIGLGFALCHVEELGGIDWYGDGTPGTAWTGTRTEPDGRCPEEGAGDYVVAADLDGDRVAEPGGMGFLDSCLLCRPYAATDLNGDGVQELVVLEEASSTPSYSFFDVSVPTSERSPGIYNLFVAPPGAANANVPADEPLRVIVGGDEGFSGGMRCEDYPAAPVLIYTWLLGEVDSNADLEGHEIRLRLGQDGVFHVLDHQEFRLPRDELPPLVVGVEPACGVDFHPDA